MKQNKNRKKLNITLLVVIVVMLSIGGVVGVSFYKDRQSFKDASRDIHSIFEALDYRASSKDTTQYCMYSHLKYSKGNLTCYVSHSFMIKNPVKNVISMSERKLEGVGWKKRGNNIDYFKEKDETYVVANIFTDKNKLNCHSRYKLVAADVLAVEIGCSGPARAEWFPVKKD